MPKVAITGLACLLALCLASRAQQQDPRGAQVDMIFAQFNQNDSPGCAVAVIQRGDIIYENGYGLADRENRVRITPKTVFHAASLAKQFTAMSIMLLVNSSDHALHVDLDDRVDKYLMMVPIATQHNIKIRHMLSHISGIRDQLVLFTLKGKLLYRDVFSQTDVLDLVSRMNAVDFEPGKQLIYSNTGYTLGSEIVKKRSSKLLSEFAKENIFNPLRMDNTHIIETHDQIPPNSAKGYTESSFQLFMPNLDITGPTNLYTTVEDLALWDRNFYDKTVGGDPALSQMRAPAMLSDGSLANLNPNPLGIPVNYGLGLMITKYRGLNVVEHDGRDAGFRSHLIRFPDQHLAVACLCNLALGVLKPLPGQLARQVANIYLPDQLGPTPHDQEDVPAPPPARAASAADLAKYAGTYHSREIDATYRVSVQPGPRLVITRDNYKDVTLEPDSALDKFKFDDWGHPIAIADDLVGHPIDGGSVQFTSNPQIDGFLLDGKRGIQPRIQQFRFDKLP
jgi:CubicO group peptidase (beta-lactamase class C family)